MIKMVYNNLDETKIYIPIHFMNLIENIKHRFNINASSLTNITPLDAYKLIESKNL